LKFVIYDIETLKTFFCACFKDFATGTKKEFKLHIIDEGYEDLLALMKFLKQLQKHEYFLVGFNNVGFDFQVIDYMIDNYELWITHGESIESIILNIYYKVQEITSIPDDEKFKRLIPERSFCIPNIDMFKQKHYDGQAKRGTSLKWLQFTTRYPNVEEMPIHHDADVAWEQIPQIMEYCWNDVDSTAMFFGLIKHETDLRLEMSKTYKIPLLNASEPKLARDIFATFLCEEMNISYRQLKEMKTFRKFIHLKDIIFPYVNFKTPEFNQVFKTFTDSTIDASPASKQEFGFTFKHKGISIDLGLGGVHGCIKSGVYDAKEGFTILDIDVTSFYPNLGIRNGIKPAHLGDSFTKVYEFLFNERQTIPKKDPRNYVYKIILNSVYGLSKEINGYLYDPLYTYSITINGQLSLLMLAEMLYEGIPEMQAYQYNTDGITIGFDNQYKDKVYEICKQWEEITNLGLEYAEYKKMVIGDVNSYLGVYKDPSKGIKRVGRFEYEMKPNGKIDYHNNPSFLIIPKAIEQHFVYGKSYEDYITNHENIYDFLGATKKKSDFELNLYTLNEDLKIVIKPQQKVTRYYISKPGLSESIGSLRKDYIKGKLSGRQTMVMAEHAVGILNNVKDDNAKNYSIDYDYYFKQVKQEIFAIEGNINQLLLWD
jgi:hypothetical protein